MLGPARPDIGPGSGSAGSRSDDEDRRPLAFVEVIPVTEASGDADAVETPAGATPAADSVIAKSAPGRPCARERFIGEA